MTSEQIYTALLQLNAGDMPLCFRMRPLAEAESLLNLLGETRKQFGEAERLARAPAEDVIAMIESSGASYD